MNYKTIELRFEDGFALLALNRPEALNALDLEMGRELIDALQHIEAERARCLLITGRGRAFCAGGDIKAMMASVSTVESGAHVVGFFREPLDTIHRAVAALAAFPRVAIAAVNGFAGGAGMNLALACDLRIAGESARFSQAFVNIGAVPDCGGTYHLPRMVGWARAAELMLTGEVIDARQAQQMGIVSRVVPDEELERAAASWARHIASGPMACYERIKKLLRASLTATLEQQLELEASMQREIGQTLDFAEGIAAFVEKRKPDFTGC